MIELKHEQMSHIRLPEPLCCISEKITRLLQDRKSWDLATGPSRVFGNWAWKTCLSLADPKNRIYDLWGQRPSGHSSLNWFLGNWSRNILWVIDMCLVHVWARPISALCLQPPPSWQYRLWVKCWVPMLISLGTSYVTLSQSPLFSHR